ncbi:hypothetical protein GCM10027569_14230 [Flindersiella endophytica]
MPARGAGWVRFGFGLLRGGFGVAVGDGVRLGTVEVGDELTVGSSALPDVRVESPVGRGDVEPSAAGLPLTFRTTPYVTPATTRTNAETAATTRTNRLRRGCMSLPWFVTTNQGSR